MARYASSRPSGISFAAVELPHTSPDFRINGVPVLQEPAVLFFLCIEKAQQRLFGAGGAGGLHLPLYSGFQIRVPDFNLHVCPLPLIYYRVFPCAVRAAPARLSPDANQHSCHILRRYRRLIAAQHFLVPGQDRLFDRNRVQLWICGGLAEPGLG